MLKYEQIANDIRNKIVNGTYPVNSQLPLEKEIMEKYDVSRITVKKAYDILVEEGLIIKSRGRGTFVKDIDEDTALIFAKSRQFLGFSTNMAQSQIETKVSFFQVELPDEDVQKKLKIGPDDWVYHFIRTRIKDGVPTVIEYTFMPMELIPGITMQVLENSIYQYVEGELKLKIQSAHRIITAYSPNEEQKKLLDLKDNVPVVNVEEITFLDTGRPFSYTQNVHNSEIFQYVSITTK